MNDIKLFAGYYVYFQENLSNNDKITFFNFIKESTNDQVSHLVLSGKMVSEEVLKKSTQRLTLEYKGWKKDMDTIAKEFDGKTPYEAWDAMVNLGAKSAGEGYKTGAIHTGVFIGGIALAALAATLAYKVYKNYLSKAAKACKGKKGTEKQQCLRKVKMDARKQKIMILTKAQGLCRKTKDPGQCVAKLKLKIAKEKAKMKK